jgi:hypothetical protein
MKIQSLLSLLVLCLALACKDEKEKKVKIDRTSSSDSIIRNSPDLPSNPYVNIDISPMDMSYFPVDYPKLKMAGAITDPPIVRVIYSRPHLQKRHLFKDLLKYDEPWRLGANEATEIDFYKPVTIQEKTIKPGRYIIYAIPHPDVWTIVLNTNIDTWGLRPDSTKDIQQFDIPVTTTNTVQEYFTMIFEKGEGRTGDLLITWDNLLARLPFSY